MKKITLGMAILGLSLFIGGATFANDCREIEFSNGRVCVDIERESNNTFSLKTDIEKGNGTLRCGILLSNNSYKEVKGCNDDFFVSNPKEQLIKIYIKLGSEYPTDWEDKPSNKQERLFPQWMYDFNDGEWTNGTSNNNTSNGDLKKFDLKLADSTPDRNDSIKLTINALDNNGNIIKNYKGRNADISIEYRSSSSSSRRSASSSYVTIDNTSPSFYDGVASTYVTFKYDYDYKITITDDDEDISSSKIFYVGDNDNDDNNGDLEEFEIKLADSTPDRNDRIKLTINALDDDNDIIDDYEGRNADISIEYRSSSSSSRRSASSSYVTIDNTSPSFYDGVASTYVTFKYDYDYKITITDDDEDISSSKIFYVGDNDNDDNEDTDNLYITADDSSPDTYQPVDISIKARDSDGDTLSSYRGTVLFEVYYRTSTTSSWKKTTSSTYYELSSSYRYGYTFTYYDYGYAMFYDLITFKKKYDFKLKIIDKDNNDIYGEKIFYVGDTNNGSYGYTASEIASVEKVYNARDALITSYKNTSRNLRYNETWISMSNDLKAEMKKIVNNASNKKYQNYQDFLEAVQDRYSYTIRNK